jgi:protein-tyrosine phosphatase
LLNILFVCTANQFRSPIAAGCFSRRLVEAGLAEDWHVNSAGTWTVNGLSTHPKAIQAAVNMGLDLSMHNSLEVNAEMLMTADLIVVMERGHREALVLEFPECRSRIILLTELVGESMSDIPDPTLSNFADCDEIAQMICQIVDNGFNELITMATSR